MLSEQEGNVVWRHRGRRRQIGASLIEVLIALTLVAVSMLGLLGLQLRALSVQKDSLDRRTAALLTAGFAERMTANFAGYETRLYNDLTLNPPGATNGTVPAAPQCTLTDTCVTNAQIATRDWALFASEVRQRLPGGVAFVTTPADLSRATITVGWLDVSRVEGNESAANVTGGVVNRDPACPATDAFNPSLNPDNARYRCYRASVLP